MHNVYYTCSAALSFVLDPTLFNLQSPTYVLHMYMVYVFVGRV